MDFCKGYTSNCFMARLIHILPFVKKGLESPVCFDVQK